jgi:colicin import membrane protein
MTEGMSIEHANELKRLTRAQEELFKRRKAEREERDRREAEERAAARARLEEMGREAFNRRVEAHIEQRRKVLSTMLSGDELERRLEAERERFIDRYLAESERAVIETHSTYS